MLGLQIKLFFRSLLKEGIYSSINIFGLALGLASSLTIYQYLIQEESYDQTHPNIENSYRVNETAIWVPGQELMGSTPIPLGEVLLNDFEEITNMTRIHTPGDAQIVLQTNSGNRNFVEHNAFAADSNFFDFFNFPLKEGNRNKILNKNNTAVISASLAEKYFGTEKALGKVFLLGDARTPIEIVGVTEKQPNNVHFNFDILFSMHTFSTIKRFEWSWIWTQMVTYVHVKEGTNISNLETKFEGIGNKHAVAGFERLGINFEDFEKENGKLNFYLQPVRDIHLYSEDIGNRLGSIGDIKVVQVLKIVLFFILLVSGINFVILSTSRASLRLKEIGVKKVLGAFRSTMVRYFLMETILICYVAMGVGLALSELIKVLLFSSDGVGLQFSNDYWGFVFLAPLVVGLVSGIYPALFLSHFKPIKALNNASAGSKMQTIFNNSLLVVQFTVSALLIFYTLFMHKQFNYLMDKNLGFDKENIVMVDHAERLGGNLNAYVETLRQNSGIKNVSFSTAHPSGLITQDFLYPYGNQNIKVPLSYMNADEDYFETYSLPLIKGRYFKKENKKDERAIVLNETAVIAFGYTMENVIGKKVQYYESVEFEVIGVVQDFNYYSLKQTIGPFGFFHTKSGMFGLQNIVNLKLEKGALQEQIKTISNLWKSYTDAPFEYEFLDRTLASQYEQEEQVKSLTTTFAIFALVIGCIGLIGIAAYNVSKKKKEIGVRKVLGASVNGIVVLISKQLLRFVLLGSILAIPFSFWGIEKWSENMPYVTSVDIWVYVIGMMILTAVAWFVISFQAFRAASADPVITLKSE